MRDYREILDREGRSLAPSADWFLEVTRRTQARRRRRAVVAGLMALAMTGAGLAVAVRAFEQPRASVPRGEVTPPADDPRPGTISACTLAPIAGGKADWRLEGDRLRAISWDWGDFELPNEIDRDDLGFPPGTLEGKVALITLADGSEMGMGGGGSEPVEVLAGAGHIVTIFDPTERPGLCGPGDPADLRPLPGPFPPPPEELGLEVVQPDSNATVQYRNVSTGPSEKAVVELHAFYLEGMEALGWVHQGGHGPSDEAGQYQAASYWVRDREGAKSGTAIHMEIAGEALSLRIYCCDESNGDPGP